MADAVLAIAPPQDIRAAGRVAAADLEDLVAADVKGALRAP